jgi:hypothetical protein
MDKEDSYQANLKSNVYIDEIRKIFDDVKSRKGVLVATK